MGMKSQKMKSVIGCGLLAVLCAGSVQARLGETREQIHRRLRSLNAGDSYDRKVQDLKTRQSPYVRMSTMLEEAGIRVEVHTWWKGDKYTRLRDADLVSARNAKGWDYSVIFFNGVSVLECCRRNSGSISVYERDAFLKLNFGTEEYQDHKQPQRKESFFGYQFESEDGQRRGVPAGGNQLIVFEAEFDRQLAEVNRQWQEKLDREAQDDFVDNILGF